MRHCLVWAMPLYFVWRIDMTAIIEAIYGFLWNDLFTLRFGDMVIGIPLLVLLLIPAGVYFTVRTRVMPIRKFPEMVRALGEKKDDKSSLSAFQTLIVSTATRVGMGNLVGVVAAISFGGAGAVFWMWVTAILGASTAYAEGTLAQLHKKKDNLYGGCQGGPAYYIHDFVEKKYSFFRQFLKMTGGVPSSQTYERVFSLIDYKQLEEILNKFYLAITYNHSNKTDTINIDGKVDKGSSRNQTDYHDKTKPLNSLNAYSNNLGICLASEIIDDKTNEIPTIPTILKRLKIKDVIITWDALNTQKENIDAVVGGKAHYVVPIKGNQGNLFSELDLYFDEKRLETIIAGNTKSAYLK